MSISGQMDVQPEDVSDLFEAGAAFDASSAVDMSKSGADALLAMVDQSAQVGKKSGKGSSSKEPEPSNMMVALFLLLEGRL